MLPIPLGVYGLGIAYSLLYIFIIPNPNKKYSQDLQMRAPPPGPSILLGGNQSGRPRVWAGGTGRLRRGSPERGPPAHAARRRCNCAEAGHGEDVVGRRPSGHGSRQAKAAFRRARRGQGVLHLVVVAVLARHSRGPSGARRLCRRHRAFPRRAVLSAAGGAAASSTARPVWIGGFVATGL